MFCVFFNREDNLDILLLLPSYKVEKEYKYYYLVIRIRNNCVYIYSSIYSIIYIIYKKVADKIYPINTNVSITDRLRASSNIN